MVPSAPYDAAPYAPKVAAKEGDLILALKNGGFMGGVYRGFMGFSGNDLHSCGLNHHFQ